MQGLLTVINRRFKSFFEKLHPGLAWLITFTLVSMSMALFRSNSIADALNLFGNVVKMEFGPISNGITNAFLLPEIQFLTRYIGALSYFQLHPNAVLLLFFAGSLTLILGARNANEHMQTFRPTVWNLLATGLLLVLCVLSFSGVSTFLYFNF